MPIPYSIQDNALVWGNFFSNAPEFNLTPVMRFTFGSSGATGQEITEQRMPRVSDRISELGYQRTRVATLQRKTYYSPPVTTEIHQSLMLPQIVVDGVTISNLVTKLAGYRQAFQRTQEWGIGVLADTSNEHSIFERYVEYSRSQLQAVWVQDTIEKLTKLASGEINEVLLMWNYSTADLLVKTYAALVGVNTSVCKTKERTLMFKFSDAMRAKQSKDAGITKQLQSSYKNLLQWSSNIDHGSGYVLSLRFIKQEEKHIDVSVKKQLTVLNLLPNLRDDMRNLRLLIQSKHRYFHNMGDLNTEQFNIVFETFNLIKNQLMFHGYNERKVADMLTTYMLKRYPTHITQPKTGVGTCHITNQVLPNCFLTDVKMLDGTTQAVSIKYILMVGYSSRAHNARTRRFEVKALYNEASSTDMYYFVEKEVSDTDQYYHDVFNYSTKNYQLLSPRWLEDESVTTIRHGMAMYQPTPWLGIELEVERRSSDDNRSTSCPENITKLVYDALGRDFVMFKSDGSLRGHHPWEIVTTPATLAYHKTRWQRFMDDKALKSNLQSFASGNCGMHVHISRDSFNGLHLAKFMRFFNADANRKFITTIAQRKENNYTKYQDFTTITDASRQLFGGERGAINRRNEHTIEVRIFRGNLSKHAFFKNLEFVHAAWQYTKDCSMQNLKYTDFLFWLFDPKNKHDKLYANLQMWLISNNYNVSNVIISRELPRDERLRREVKRGEAKKIQRVINRKFNTTEEAENIRNGAAAMPKKEVVNNQ